MPKTKFILAGPSERQQYFFHAYNDNSVRFVLNYSGIIDSEAMKKTVKTIVNSVDILHGSFFTDAVNAYWRINENIDDIHYYHYIRCSGDPSETAYSLSLFPVFAEDKVQLRVWLVQSDSASSLVVVVSHLCADGGDSKYLLTKIIEGYNMVVTTGNCDALQVKNGSRAPEKLYSELDAKEVLGLVGMVTKQVPKALSLYPFPTEGEGTVQYLRKVIPADVMGAARKKAKEVGASANDLLVAALTQAYASLDAIDQTQPISVTSMMDLRRHCKDGESEGLCNMSGSMPSYMENGVQGSFEDTLKEVNAQLTAAKNDPYAGLAGMPMIHSVTRTFPVGLLLKTVGKMYEKASLGLTNLGNITCADYALGGIAPDSGFFGGPVKKKPGMQVAAMSFDGECVLAVCGQFTAEDATLLQSTLDAMANYIEAYGKE